MTSAPRAVALAASLIGFASSAAAADAIIPDDITYTSRVEESDEAKICEIVLVATNTTPPERVDFTAFAGFDKLENALGFGFLIGAAEQPGPGEFKILTISSGGFNSATFNSPDEMDHEVYGDGTFMAATSDRVVAARFVESIAKGDFRLTLASDEPEIRDWTYRIASGPSASVQRSFATCLDTLLPSTVSMRASRNHLSILPATMPR